MKNIKNITVSMLFVLILSMMKLNAQLNMPRISPRAEVSQTIGLSKITVDYSRPGVKGRQIWGKLVPFGLSKNSIGLKSDIPWRAGADENTTITLSDDAIVNGEKIPAGKYGLHIIPNQNEEWIVIFSSDNSAWGSFFYEQKNDVLRLKVKPDETEFQEWLEYSFENLSENSCDLKLKWEKVAISVNIQFDVHKIVINSLKQQLKGIAGFNWQSWNQAAAYCLQINEYLDLGIEWCRISISLNENPNNRNLLAYLLMAMGNEADALNIFQENVKKFPNNWNVFDSYGEALKKNGKILEARKNYEKALELAPENQKERIRTILKQL